MKAVLNCFYLEPPVANWRQQQISGEHLKNKKCRWSSRRICERRGGKAGVNPPSFVFELNPKLRKVADLSTFLIPLRFLHAMNVISKKKIDAFCKIQTAAESVLITWYKKAVKAQWSNFAEVRQDYPSADWIGDDRIVFNIGGNKYRLIVRVSFVYKNMMIKWIGTHADYDKIDAASVS